MSMQHQITTGAHKNKRRTRKGRGEGSGRGKTSGRGTKGSGARTGTYIIRGYEGGQTPIWKRFPKRGFSNVNFTTRYHIVNLGDLCEHFEEGTTIDQAALMEKGLIPDDRLGVKVLSEGEVTKKLTIRAAWYSKTAHEAVLAKGGTALTADGDTFAFPKPKKKFIPREKEAKAKKGAEPAEAAAAPAAAASAAPAAE